MKVHIRPLPDAFLRRIDSDDDDDDDTYRRREGGWGKDCCCQPYTMITGFVIGLLICAAGTAPALTILLIQPGKTTSTVGIRVASSVASTVSTIISPNIVVAGSSSLSYTTDSSSSTYTTDSSSSTSSSSASTTSTTDSSSLSYTTDSSSSTYTTDSSSSTSSSSASTTSTTDSSLSNYTTDSSSSSYTTDSSSSRYTTDSSSSTSSSRTSTTSTTGFSTNSTKITTSKTTKTTKTTTTTTTAPWCTTYVTFDNIPNESPPSGNIPNGYDNLNFTNALYLDALTAPVSGYQTAVYTYPYIAYNPGGANVTITTANGTRFAFDSIVVAPVWRNNLNFTISGYTAGTLMISGSFLLNVTNQTIVSCGVCSNWDTISMTTAGGTPYPGLSQNGTEFGFDSLCISFGY